MNIPSKVTSGVLVTVVAMASIACCTANCSSKKTTAAPPTSSTGPGGERPVALIRIAEPDFYASSSYFPDLGITLTRGFAPFPVFFEGWPSSPREELVRYDWDFGAGTETDEMGRTFEGFNAAHVFETPGTYTTSLRVMNASRVWSNPVTVSITVLSRDSANTYYVDSAVGADSNDGKSPTTAMAPGRRPIRLSA
jgi:hypothetical protein